MDEGEVEQTETKSEFDDIESVIPTSIPTLPFTLLQKRGNKTTKLLANSGDDVSMDGASRWFDYDFADSAFVFTIRVEIENYGRFDEFGFRWQLENGEFEHASLRRVQENVYEAKINQLVQRVSFLPPKKWLSSPRINRVILTGVLKQELDDHLELISDLDSLRDTYLNAAREAVKEKAHNAREVSLLNKKYTELVKLNEQSEKKQSELNSEIGRLTEQRNELSENVESRRKSNTELESQSEEIQETITERRKTRASLASEIADQRSTLKSLQDDINMFPTEIGAFVQQGGSNIKTYIWLAVIPMLLLVIVTALLIFNAANLTTVVDENDNARIWSIFLTRIPYVVIATAIITAGYKLARIFIEEIIRINQQRLNLSKISIIATDISKTSEDDLEGLSEEKIHELRTQIKMDMLRDHLKEYISNDFSYVYKSPLKHIRDKILPSNSGAGEVNNQEDIAKNDEVAQN
jgi:hypothetical protein